MAILREICDNELIGSLSYIFGTMKEKQRLPLDEGIEDYKMGNAEENKIEIMMVQLLFRQKPKSPTTAQMRAALERYLGDLGEVPYAETSKESTGDMYMFPLLKYKAVLKDSPDGVPVMATFLGSDGESGIEVDDMLVDPLRTVLDVNCGEFAGGNSG